MIAINGAYKRKHHSEMLQYCKDNGLVIESNSPQGNLQLFSISMTPLQSKEFNRFLEYLDSPERRRDMRKMKKLNKSGTNKYRYCNHHHKLDKDHRIVDFGDGEFVANIEAIPLLKALNKLGLRTRTHHIKKEGHAFVSILIDDPEISVEIRTVEERDADRVCYNGKKELLISWERSSNKKGR